MPWAIGKEDQKIFEDHAIRAELSIEKIEGKEIFVSMVIKNKTANQLNFNSRDFVYKSDAQFGKLSTGRMSYHTDESVSPGWEEMKEVESHNQAIQRMKAQLKNVSKFHDHIFPEINLSGGDEITRNYVINFDHKINPKNFEFFFRGNYKQLLKI